MAHLFLASKLSFPEDGGKARLPRSASTRISNSFSSDKLSNHSKPSGMTSSRSVGVVTRGVTPTTAQMRLSAATGGNEASCWRCLLPFGAVLLVAGAVLTAVGFIPGTAPLPSTAPLPRMGLLGLALLGTAVLMLGTSAICWKLSQRKKRETDKRRESQTALVQHAHTVA